MLVLELPITDMIRRIEESTEQLDDIKEIKKNIAIAKTLRQIIEIETHEQRAARYINKKNK